MPTAAPTLDSLPGLKSGFKTSEFWVTLAAYVVGTILLARGQDLPASIVFSVATGGYHASRGIAKLGAQATSDTAPASAPTSTSLSSAAPPAVSSS